MTRSGTAVTRRISATSAPPPRSTSTSDARRRRMANQLLRLSARPSVNFVEILERARREIPVARHHGFDMARDIGKARAPAEKRRHHFLVRRIETRRHRAACRKRLIREPEAGKPRRIRLLEA